VTIRSKVKYGEGLPPRRMLLKFSGSLLAVEPNIIEEIVL